MGIRNSSSPPIEQRVGNPITEKKHKKIDMKAFTTACALMAGVSAESHIGLPFGAAGFFPGYNVHHPIVYTRPVYGIHPGYHAGFQPISAGHPLFKREAEPEPRFPYQTKVTHPDEKSVYEYHVNVDQMGHGKSYQFHQRQEQKQDMMRQHQRQNQRQNQMSNQVFGRMDQINGHKMQYNMENHMGNRMHQNNQMGNRMHQNNQVMRQRDNQMMGARDNQMRNEHGYNMFDRMIEQREAESGFEYDVTAEHDNSDRQMMSRNQQMMDVMTRPQQTYHRNNQMDSRINSHMNQMNNQHTQYNINNRMDGRINQNEQMLQRHNNEMMNQHSNQMMNQRNQYQMDTRMNRMDTHMNHMNTQMNQMHGRNNQRLQYNRNNQMTNQMHQRQFGDNTFGFDRASMQFQNNQFRNYY